MHQNEAINLDLDANDFDDKSAFPEPELAEVEQSNSPNNVEFWQLIDDELKTRDVQNQSPLSAPPMYERDTESLISQVLKGKDPEFRAHVINTAYRYGLDKNDPLLIILLATGQLELLLEQKPDEIDNFFKQWQSKWQLDLKDSQAIISQELEQVQQFVDNWAQSSRELLERQSKAAITVQSRNISNSVKTLVRQAALEKVAHDIWSVIFGSGVVFSAIAIGIFVGLAIPRFTPSPELDPTGLRQLTLKEAAALEWGLSNEGQFAQKNADTIRWAMSNEGKYARQFMSWNQALLSEKNGKKLCETEVNRLGVTLTVEGKPSKGGFCTLWTRSPQERQFVSN
ncbi:hypothetical protein IQ264_24385 [Phormidium sp. LEGE 05292]|uniref:DUF6753 family protein n=1 Tax=[Phormidium] sp. LEGE 05292 TaxID=767427 RepID=UPI001880E791|nr:DUF6753 family protein [Phormidium sp. LEGE 05292]MBE9228558.1 hypothetical protein [Phormidium sp. LEGE 05292]